MANNEDQIFSILLLSIVALTATGGMLMMRLWRERSKASEMRTWMEKEVARARLETYENLSKMIVADIHDNCGQLLSVSKMMLQCLPLDQPEAMADQVQDLISLNTKVSDDLRSIIRRLSSDNIQFPLQTQIERELNYLNKTGLYQAVLTIEGVEQKLLPEVNIIFFRMIQESLQNIIKHANASKIDIMLRFTETELYCRVKDDGRGFDVERSVSAGGFGLKNLYRRARLIKGNLQIQSSTGQGTQIIISIPLPKPKPIEK